MSYQLHKEYRFTVCDEEFAITSFNGFRAFVEETRKNGQEDTHTAGDLILRDGRWVWEDDWSRKRSSSTATSASRRLS